nr:MAG TPA: hypothetical protein [Caudoviricetes sp.]DAW86238.1 MAG TPA: hypothetical protein [Bacteriophage sp.]
MGIRKAHLRKTDRQILCINSNCSAYNNHEATLRFFSSKS